MALAMFGSFGGARESHKFWVGGRASRGLARHIADYDTSHGEASQLLVGEDRSRSFQRNRIVWLMWKRQRVTMSRSRLQGVSKARFTPITENRQTTG